MHNDMSLNGSLRRAWTIGLVGTSVMVWLLAGTGFGVLATEGSSTHQVDSGRGGIAMTGADGRQIEQLREGTQLESQLGHFKVTGDRLTFYAAGGTYRVIGLENLNLERISRMAKDSLSMLEWNVSGTITEYRVINFLLVERAVLKSTTTSACPTPP